MAFHANNYETTSTFVEVMQKKPVASFCSGHGVFYEEIIKSEYSLYTQRSHNAVSTPPISA